MYNCLIILKRTYVSHEPCHLYNVYVIFLHHIRHEKIAKEDESVNLISQLIISEFLRQNKEKELTNAHVTDNSHATHVIATESKNAHNAIFGGLMKSRIKVAGMERKDLNGRQGTLRYWDANQNKFCVRLDTKRASDCDEHFLLPENVESVGSNPRSGKGDKKSGMHQGYHVDIKDLFNQGDDGIGCLFTIDKSTITAIRSAKSIGDGLQAFCLERDANDERVRLEKEEERRQEVEYRKQDEIDRKRRAKKRAEKREERERERERRRQRAEIEREVASRRRMEEKKAALMDKFHAFCEKENKRIVLGFIKQLVTKGCLSKEDAEEFLEEHLDDLLDDLLRDPRSIIDSIMMKLHEFFEFKAEEYRREEQEKDDKESAEILGKKTRKELIQIFHTSAHLKHYILSLLFPHRRGTRRG